MNNTLADFDRILSEPPASLAAPTITILGMVRAAERTEDFAFALGDSGDWAVIPRSFVESVRSLGSLQLKDQRNAVVELTLKRPNTEPGVFDLLAYTLRRSAELATRAPCSCSGAVSAPISQAGSQSAPNARPSNFKCFLCWLYTGGAGEQWCWETGQC